MYIPEMCIITSLQQLQFSDKCHKVTSYVNVIDGGIDVAHKRRLTDAAQSIDISVMLELRTFYRENVNVSEA